MDTAPSDEAVEAVARMRCPHLESAEQVTGIARDFWLRQTREWLTVAYAIDFPRVRAETLREVGRQRDGVMDTAPSDEAMQAAVDALRRRLPQGAQFGPALNTLDALDFATTVLTAAAPIIRAATLREVVAWLREQGQQVEVGWTGWTVLAAEAIATHFNPEAE